MKEHTEEHTGKIRLPLKRFKAYDPGWNEKEETFKLKIPISKSVSYRASAKVKPIVELNNTYLLRVELYIKWPKERAEDLVVDYVILRGDEVYSTRYQCSEWVEWTDLHNVYTAAAATIFDHALWMNIPEVDEEKMRRHATAIHILTGFAETKTVEDLAAMVPEPDSTFLT